MNEWDSWNDHFNGRNGHQSTSAHTYRKVRSVKVTRRFFFLPTVTQQDFIQNVWGHNLFTTLLICLFGLWSGKLWRKVLLGIWEALFLNCLPTLSTPRALDALMSEDILPVSRRPGYWRTIPPPTVFEGSDSTTSQVCLCVRTFQARANCAHHFLGPWMENTDFWGQQDQILSSVLGDSSEEPCDIDGLLNISEEKESPILLVYPASFLSEQLFSFAHLIFMLTYSKLASLGPPSML